MIPAFDGLYAVLLKLCTRDSSYQAGLCHAGFPVPPGMLSSVPGSAFCTGNNAPTPVVTTGVSPDVARCPLGVESVPS